MRTIIIIQTLIIIAGAYYIYTLAQTPPVTSPLEGAILE